MLRKPHVSLPAQASRCVLTPSIDPVSQPLSPSEETTLPTLDDIARARQDESSKQDRPPQSSSSDSAVQSPEIPSLDDTEEEASQEGAFNEETGEINWDCPCLGGMAHGTCGEQFKAAFSCFVFSKEDPKGMECVDNFKAMQNCFRQHPEEYGDELAPPEGEEGSGVGGPEDELPPPSSPGEVMADAVTPVPRTADQPEEPGKPSASPVAHQGPKGGEGDEVKVTERAKQATEQVTKDHGSPLSESDAIVPKASHDAR